MQKLFSRQLELAKSKILQSSIDNLAADDYSNVVYEATKVTAPVLDMAGRTSEIKEQITDHTNCPVGMKFTAGEKREYALYSFPITNGIAHMDIIFSKHFWNKEVWLSNGKLLMKVFHETAIATDETAMPILDEKVTGLVAKINAPIEKFKAASDKFNEEQLKPLIAEQIKVKLAKNAVA